MTAIARITCGWVLVLLLAACGQVPAGSAVPGSPTSIATESAASAAATTPGVGSSSTPGDSLPPIPAGMPIYPGARSVETDGIAWAIAAWSTTADPPDAYAFYLAELPQAGFVIDGAMPGGDAAAIRFSTPGGEPYQLDLNGHAPVLITLGVPHD